MTTKEPKTKSKEKKRKGSEYSYYLKSQGEDKPRTSVNFLKRAFRSMSVAFTITNFKLGAILETQIMIFTKASQTNINKMV